MTKVTKLIKDINEFVRKADGTNELEELLKDHPNKKKLITAIDDYETKIGKLLRNQQKEFTEALKLYTEGSSTDDPVIGAIVEMVMEDIKESDDFNIKMAS